MTVDVVVGVVVVVVPRLQPFLYCSLDHRVIWGYQLCI